jgi:hypothetical protein
LSSRFATRGVPAARVGDRARAAASIATPSTPARGRRSARGRPRVVVEPVLDAEAVAQRRRQQPGARRRADQRERRQVERDRPRAPGRPRA